MEIFKGISTISLVATVAFAAHAAEPLSLANMNALQGLVPVTANSTKEIIVLRKLCFNFLIARTRIPWIQNG
jgi:hypothetical protein